MVGQHKKLVNPAKEHFNIIISKKTQENEENFQLLSSKSENTRVIGDQLPC